MLNNYPYTLTPEQGRWIAKEVYEQYRTSVVTISRLDCSRRWNGG